MISSRADTAKEREKKRGNSDTVHDWQVEKLKLGFNYTQVEH